MNTALSLGLTASAIVLASIGLTAWMSRRVVEIVPAKGRFVEIDGQRIQYLDQGEGPCLVLIHGLGGQTGHLTYDLVDRLTESFRVIVVDRPGSGHSPAFRQGKSGLSRQASLIAALMEHLKLGPSLILGHSLGGAIALALALDNPALVRGLVLVSPLTQIETRVPDAFKLLAIRSAILRRVVGWAVATPASMLGSKPVLAALFGPDTPPSDFGTRGGGLLSLRPSAYIAASCDLAAAEEDMAALTQRYSALTPPVSLIFGKGDRILDHQKHGQLFSNHPNVEDYQLIDGGHMLPITASEQVASVVQSANHRWSEATVAYS